MGNESYTTQKHAIRRELLLSRTPCRRHPRAKATKISSSRPPHSGNYEKSDWFSTSSRSSGFSASCTFVDGETAIAETIHSLTRLVADAILVPTTAHGPWASRLIYSQRILQDVHLVIGAAP